VNCIEVKPHTITLMQVAAGYDCLAERAYKIQENTEQASAQ
jgi:hypothetical protein